MSAIEFLLTIAGIIVVFILVVQLGDTRNHKDSGRGY